MTRLVVRHGLPSNARNPQQFITRLERRAPSSTRRGLIWALHVVDSLGSELSTEFQARLLAGLERLQTSGGITVEPDVVLTRAHKPRTDGC
jgi:hypothetical protein